MITIGDPAYISSNGNLTQAPHTAVTTTSGNLTVGITKTTVWTLGEMTLGLNQADVAAAGLAVGNNVTVRGENFAVTALVTVVRVLCTDDMSVECCI